MRSRLLPVTSGLLIVGFFVACSILTSTSTHSLAAPPEAARGMTKWEYCTFTVRNDNGLYITWTTGGEEDQAVGWSEMADKMKAPVKGKDPSETKFRVAVFDLLGAQGWELVSLSVVFESDKGKTTRGTETIVFKRMR